MKRKRPTSSEDSIVNKHRCTLALSRFFRIKLNIMAVTAANLHDDKGPKILAVLWTLTGLTTVMVIARVYIRLKLLRNFGMDDYLIVASMVRNLKPCLI